MVARRVSGEPLEHILGWAEFCGLKIMVEPGVSCPAGERQFVDQVVRLMRPGAVVVDLCCGSGAISAALLVQVLGVELTRPYRPGRCTLRSSEHR